MTTDSGTALLAGKIALITGGSSGIGAATARKLAAQGATIAIGYHHGADRAQALLEALPGAGHLTLRLPLADDAAHQHAAQALRTAYGRLDILVHSAGYTQRIPHRDVEQLTPALYNEILLANAGGPYAITRAMLPLLQASRDAVVIGVSSVSAITGSGSNMAYCAAKAALDTTLRSLARVFGPIRFLSVSPASVDTGFVAGRSRADLERHAANIPLGRVTSPEDVADSILAAAALLRTATGVRLVIDGGHTL
ncbi:SDR family NAD(P)-dependent oxidoreductase [Achromobacter aloeverae]